MRLINFNTNPTYFSDGEETPSRPKIPKRKFSEADLNLLEISSPHAAVNRVRAEDAFEQKIIQDRIPRSLQQAKADMKDIDQEGNPAPEDLPLEPRFAIVVSGYNQTVDSEELVDANFAPWRPSLSKFEKARHRHAKITRITISSDLSEKESSDIRERHDIEGEFIVAVCDTAGDQISAILNFGRSSLAFREPNLKAQKFISRNTSWQVEMSQDQGEEMNPESNKKFKSQVEHWRSVNQAKEKVEKCMEDLSRLNI